MSAISVSSIALYSLSVVLQLVMISVLPATKGFTAPVPTAVAILSMIIAFALFARLLAAGVQLSFLIPVSAAIIPLGAIAVGVLVYGEPASWAKIGMLVGAAVLIGAANTFR